MLIITTHMKNKIISNTEFLSSNERARQKK